jgi:hypothetical protein
MVKPLRGFGGAGVLEIVEDHAGYLSRRVQVRLACRKYVLRAFQKKSKSGIHTRAEQELREFMWLKHHSHELKNQQLGKFSLFRDQEGGGSNPLSPTNIFVPSFQELADRPIITFEPDSRSVRGLFTTTVEIRLGSA